ncbi:hypothetical protein Zm00014a_033958 [Zea mays]|uniref:Uncharacterized protein n=1 Tax=Zea mays TaxID=4577 RepID=A0A3L6G7P0_MAIZE|nr:hypothetical protein Zm00014a_033958 [Zea mays]
MAELVKHIPARYYPNKSNYNYHHVQAKNQFHFNQQKENINNLGNYFYSTHFILQIKVMNECTVIITKIPDDAHWWYISYKRCPKNGHGRHNI